MKRLDRLIISGFIPPFAVTFFIALFVLTMQTLWVYIDDMIGKGASLLMITEFIFYLSVSLFVMALPIAILISSVMLLGNLAEHYELSSMKSAGISLTRVMRPLMILCSSVAVFSYISSNYLTPVANLKFKSRLYDMRKQKPTLNMEEGIFNDDFDGYRIRIGEKGKDNKTIKNVFIANHVSAQRNKLNELIAKGGIMYNTPDERYLVMELEDGQQFQEGVRYSASGQSKAPFVRTSFQKYTKIFDMSEFDISRTDEELFRNHYSMLSVGQLQTAIDSIDVQIESRKSAVGSYLEQYLTAKKKRNLASDTLKDAIIHLNKAPLGGAIRVNDDSDKEPNDSMVANIPNATNTATNRQYTRELRERNKKLYRSREKVTPQNIDKDLTEYTSLLETFPKDKRRSFVDKAIQQARSIKSNAESGENFIKKTKEKRVKHVFELYSKYANAIVCFVFLFIGAPMGALVGKGGFGYPLLIAIIFFMLYITLTLTFKRMAEAFVMPVELAVWMPNLIILPIGLFLTYQAMNDSRIFDAVRLRAFVRNIASLIFKGKRFDK